MTFPNPKQHPSTRSGRASWYPYYAGFSYSFADEVLRTAGLARDAVILDPWNGAGTTTSAAWAGGWSGIGIDLNPAMVVVAKARCLSSGEKGSLGPIANDLIKKARQGLDEPNSADPLTSWLLPQSASSLRAIQVAINRLLVEPSALNEVGGLNSIEALSDLASFYYTALFRTTREYLSGFVPTNPTWTKRPTDPRRRLRPSAESIFANFLLQVSQMSEAIDESKDPVSTECTPPSIRVANSEELPLPSESADFVLTSPPYCTRIDYAVATLGELAVLGFHPDADVPALRERMIGTSKVPPVAPPEDVRWGQTCLQFLHRVARHKSKASGTYYYKNHCSYFDGLFRSLSEIPRVLRPGASCVLVVQDSFYKDIHNDLPAIVDEMMAGLGMLRYDRTDFAISTVMSNVHPGARSYRTRRTAIETVTGFRRSE